MILSCPKCRIHVETQTPPLKCVCGLVIYPSEIHQSNVRPVRGGVGSELSKIIPAFFKHKNCNCSNYADRLDRLGVPWCVDNKQEIVQYLVEQAKKSRIVKFLGPLNTFQARQWVATAIDNAIAKERVPDSDWFVAITAAPRKEPTLLTCIASVRDAGWEPIVFAEPETPTTTCKTVAHAIRKGVWHNWLFSARAGIGSGKPYILTIQDDIVLHPETKSIADGLMETSTGFISLYTSAKYTRGRQPGLFRVTTSSLWGACAIAWKRESLIKMLDTPKVAAWIGASVRTKSARKGIYKKRRENPHLIANSDTAIGKLMTHAQLPMMFLNPSPARHIAHFSSINHGGNGGNRNCGNCADHFRSLDEQVFPG